MGSNNEAHLLVFACCFILSGGLQLSGGRLSAGARDGQACWEYLFVGHANSSILGDGALKDLSNFADSAASFSGKGNFAYYVDTAQGVDVGYVTREAAAKPGQMMMPDDSQNAASAASFVSQNVNAKLTSTQHFQSFDGTDFPTLFQAATKQLDLTDSACPKIVSYSGHGYNFNGIGYQDHHFRPWQNFFGALTDAFSGPVDLLALDTCRGATYMMLKELQGSAKYVLAQQDTSIYLRGYGSWSFETLPFATATDVTSFGTRVLEDTMSKATQAESKGLVFIDMQRFQEFSESFEKLTGLLQQHMGEMMPILLQARRGSLELRGPSLYEPDSTGMLVDLGSFFQQLKDALSAATQSAQVDSAGQLLADADTKRRAAMLAEKHDESEELAGVSGISLWFMKPEPGGMHQELLQHIHERLLRTSGGAWAEFLGAYYAEAGKSTLSADDMHDARSLPAPLP